MNRAFGPDIVSPSSLFCHAHGSRSERDTKSPTGVKTNDTLSNGNVETLEREQVPGRTQF